MGNTESKTISANYVESYPLVIPASVGQPQNLNKQSLGILSKNLFNGEANGKQNVIGKDNRKKVNKIVYPYTAIGFLSFKFGNSKRRGTAFLIGDNLAATCAHNLYDHKSKEQATQILFYPGLQQSKGQEYKVIRIFYPEQFKTNESNKYQYAILQFNKSIGRYYGYFGLDFTQKKFSQIVNVCGYPYQIQIKGKKEKAGQLQYQQSGKWQQDGQNILRYKINTSRGQSGSPIFYMVDDKAYVIGIHCSGQGLFNKGHLFSQKTKEDLQKWVGNLDTSERLIICSQISQQLERQIKEKKITILYIKDYRKNRLQLLGLGELQVKLQRQRRLGVGVVGLGLGVVGLKLGFRLLGVGLQGQQQQQLQYIFLQFSELLTNFTFLHRFSLEDDSLFNYAPTDDQWNQLVNSLNALASLKIVTIRVQEKNLPKTNWTKKLKKSITVEILVKENGSP